MGPFLLSFIPKSIKHSKVLLYAEHVETFQTYNRQADHIILQKDFDIFLFPGVTLTLSSCILKSINTNVSLEDVL